MRKITLILFTSFSCLVTLNAKESKNKPTILDVICDTPIDLTVTDVTDVSATLSWNPAVGTSPLFYQYYIGTTDVADVGPTTNSTAISTSDADSYGDLLPNTTYYVYIRCFCLNQDTGESTWSDWSTSVSFTTLPEIVVCEPPLGLVASDITATSVTLNWDTATGLSPLFYQYYIGTTNVPTAGPSANGTTASTTDVDSYGDLVPETTYYASVRSFCFNPETNTADFGDWSTTIEFTTLPEIVVCEPPLGLVASDITATSVTLNWDTATGLSPIFYQYFIGTTNVPTAGPSANGTTASTTDVDSYGDLVPETTYYASVRSFCFNPETNTADFGDWSTTIEFTTLPDNLSTEQLVFKALKVYPNPVVTTLTIFNDESINSIDLYNVLGQRILSKTYDRNEISLDMSAFKNGIYMLQIKSGKNIKNIKISKQ